eukprot:5086099-Pleurochrysis_carterae.AAC.1
MTWHGKWSGRFLRSYMHSQCFKVDDSTMVLADRRPSKPFATNRPSGVPAFNSAEYRLLYSTPGTTKDTWYYFIKSRLKAAQSRASSLEAALRTSADEKKRLSGEVSKLMR